MPEIGLRIVPAKKDSDKIKFNLADAHHAFWTWQAYNPDKDDDEWPGWDEIGLKFYVKYGRVFACEAAGDGAGVVACDSCDNCPLEWPEEQKCLQKPGFLRRPTCPDVCSYEACPIVVPSPGSTEPGKAWSDRYQCMHSGRHNPNSLYNLWLAESDLEKKAKIAITIATLKWNGEELFEEEEYEYEEEEYEGFEGT